MHVPHVCLEIEMVLFPIHLCLKDNGLFFPQISAWASITHDCHTVFFKCGFFLKITMFHLCAQKDFIKSELQIETSQCLKKKKFNPNCIISPLFLGVERELSVKAGSITKRKSIVLIPESDFMKPLPN